MKRLLAIAISILALVGFSPVAAHAAYPPGSATVSSSSATPTPGSSVTLSAAGFCSGATVAFSIGSTALGTATAAANGTASFTAVMPSTAGRYTVTAATSNERCPLTASLALNVAVPANPLPVTGSDSASIMNFAVLALLLGVGMVIAVAMRRRTANVTK
jgi:hypothetical protein